MRQDEKLLWFSRPKPIAKLSGYELFLIVSISAGCLALPLYVFYTDPGFLISSPVPFWVKMPVGGLAVLGVSLLPITLLAKKRHRYTLYEIICEGDIASPCRTAIDITNYFFQTFGK